MAIYHFSVCIIFKIELYMLANFLYFAAECSLANLKVVYKACVRSVVSYEAECWAIKTADIR